MVQMGFGFKNDFIPQCQKVKQKAAPGGRGFSRQTFGTNYLAMNGMNPMNRARLIASSTFRWFLAMRLVRRRPKIRP
jgi:hypothetical protein